MIGRRDNDVGSLVNKIFLYIYDVIQDLAAKPKLHPAIKMRLDVGS